MIDSLEWITDKGAAVIFQNVFYYILSRSARTFIYSIYCAFSNVNSVIQCLNDYAFHGQNVTV
jgi:hypothetical protein